MKRALLYLACLPVDALGLCLVALLALSSGQPLNRGRWWAERGCLVYCPPREGWLARRWQFSTTLGHVVVMHPAVVGQGYVATFDHELVHVAQCEALCCLWWLCTLVSWSPLLASLSPIAWLVAYLCGSLTALLAGRSSYLGNVYEAHANGSEV